MTYLPSVFSFQQAVSRLGSISAALSCLVWSLPERLRVTSGRSAGSSPEQRLVIEPISRRTSSHASCKNTVRKAHIPMLSAECSCFLLEMIG